MSHVKVRARVWNMEDPSKFREVEVLVDTGSTYTILPRSLLEELGVKPIGKRKLRLADGRIIERDVGIIGIEVEGEKIYTPVIFGDEGVHLLGVITLEELGLELDPSTGKLKHADALPMFQMERIEPCVGTIRAHEDMS